MAMGNRLQGKSALVTAAGQGTGRAIVEAFLREGASVVATDVDEAKLAGLDGAVLRRLDVTDRAAVVGLVREIGAVDVLVNVAGHVHQGTVLECSDEDWDLSFDVNVKSMHRMIGAFLPKMLGAGGGSIINMASCVSSIAAAPNRYAYGATKAAVIGLTKSVAADFVRRGIRCNAICPGTIDTPSLNERVSALAEEMGGADKAREMFVARQPMGRLASAAEVAQMAVYLAADESAYVTGTAMVIDGGWSM